MFIFLSRKALVDKFMLAFSSGLRPANATPVLLSSPGQADRSTAYYIKQDLDSAYTRLTVIGLCKSCPFSCLLGRHHPFTRYVCKASRR